MRRRFVLLFLFTAMLSSLSSFVNGQNEISGKIADASTGLPLHGVSVYIPDLKTGTASGADGSYLIKNIPSGTYVIEVSIIGYAKQLEKITIKGASKKRRNQRYRNL